MWLGRPRFAPLVSIWVLGANSDTGDALVRNMLLTPSRPPDYTKTIDPTPVSALNTEGGTWESGTKNLILGSESRMVYHWPQARYEQ